MLVQRDLLADLGALVAHAEIQRAFAGRRPPVDQRFFTHRLILPGIKEQGFAARIKGKVSFGDFVLGAHALMRVGNTVAVMLMIRLGMHLAMIMLGLSGQRIAEIVAQLIGVEFANGGRAIEPCDRL